MKKVLAAFVLALVPGLRAEQPIDANRLLDCIAQVEGNDTRKIGANGERSRYQLTRSVWYKYTPLHFENASSTLTVNRSLQDLVAGAHLGWLRIHVERPTVYRLALAWNAGVSAANSGNITNAQADYARRVRNLYNSDL